MKRTILMLVFGFSVGVSSIYGHGNENIDPYIRVSGEGEVKVIPDQVIMQIGIQTSNRVLEKAKSENDQKTRKFLAMLKKYKIQEKDIQSTNVRIHPRYNWTNRKRIFDTYEVHRSFNVKIRDLKKYDRIMSGAVEAGMDLASGISFRSSKQKELESEARKKAVANALKKAKELTSSIDQKVGKAIFIEETGGSRPQYKHMRRMAAMDSSAEASPPTIAPGESKIVSQVSVKFELK